MCLKQGCSTILSIGDDNELLQSRELVLTWAGYRVLSVPSSTWLNEALCREVSIAILCYSISQVRLAEISGALDQRGVPVLHLRPDFESTESDSICSAHPVLLLQGIERAQVRFRNAEHVAA